MTGLENLVLAHPGESHERKRGIRRRFAAVIGQWIKAQRLQDGRFEFDLAGRRGEAGLFVFFEGKFSHVVRMLLGELREIHAERRHPKIESLLAALPRQLFTNSPPVRQSTPNIVYA